MPMLFSVIIPVYNVAPYLRACLDSVIAAVGGAAVEIICVDDGSTDGSGAILDEYAERFNSSNRGSEHASGEEEGNASDVHLHLLSPPPNSPVFRILHQKNAGVSAARNAALKVASGEWVVFVDADDVVTPNYFSVLVDAAQSHGEVDLLAFGNIEFLDGNQPVFQEGVWEWQTLDVSHRLQLAEVNIDLWRAAFRRSLICGLRFMPYCHGEDMLFVTECLCKAQRIGVCKIALYGYRGREGSAMRSPMTVKKLCDRLGFVQGQMNALQSSGKMIEQSVYRGLGLTLTEGFVSGILGLRGKDEKKLMWHKWFECIEKVKSKIEFPTWIRFTMKVCDRFRWRWLAWSLCYVPWWLKTKGLHR